MGFLERVGKIAAAGARGVVDVAEIPWDMVRAPFSEEENENFVVEWWHAIRNNGAEFLDHTISGSGVVGSTIGAIPESIRSLPADTLGGATRGMEAASQVVDDTLGFYTNFAAIALGPGDESIADAYTKAGDLALSRSFGQSLNLAINSAAEAIVTGNAADVTDEAWVRSVKEQTLFGVDSWRWTTGATDALRSLFLDPTVIGGKAVSTARAARKAEALKDIEKGLSTVKGAKFVDDVVNKSEATLRDVYFPNHADGAELSAVLKEASRTVTDPDELSDVIRYMAGDPAVSARVRETNLAVASMIDRQRAVVNAAARRPTTMGFNAANNAEALAAAKAELALLDSRIAYTTRLDRLEGVLREVPWEKGPTQALRSAVKDSHFLTDSRLGITLRAVFFDMNAPRYVVHDDLATADVGLRRMLSRSAIPADEADEIVSSYIRASSPLAKAAVVDAASTRAVESVALANGMAPEVVTKLMAEAQGVRDFQAALLASREATKGGGSAVFFIDPETGENVQQIFLASQQASMSALPDMDLLNQIASKSWARKGVVRVTTDRLDDFMGVWKPAVLARPGGYTFRLMTDDGLRFYAKLGGLATAKAVKTGTTTIADRSASYLARRAIGPRWSDSERVSRLLKAVSSQSVKAREIARYGARAAKDKRFEGVSIPGAFGAIGDQESIIMDLASSKPGWDNVLDAERSILKTVRTGAWDRVEGADPRWVGSLTEQLHRHLANDPVARLMLSGKDDAVAREFLNTPKGAAHLRKLGFRGSDPDALVGQVRKVVTTYTADDPDLMAKALRRSVSAGDLERVFPDAALRPVVTTEETMQILGTSSMVPGLNRFLGRIMDVAARAPVDSLLRHPYLGHEYLDEMDRLLTIKAAGRGTTKALLSADDIAAASSAARNYALDEARTHLYDLANSARLSGVLRFASPFFDAWREQMVRWAGIAVERPDRVRRLQQAWYSPDKAGLVKKDENGRSFIAVTAPTWARDLPVVSWGLNSRGQFFTDKQAMVLVASGMPSAGPIAAIPVNEMVKDRPDLAGAAGWFLPFGPVENFYELFEPTLIDRVRQAVDSGSGDATYAGLVNKLWTDKLVDYNAGVRTDRPTFAEAQHDAKQFENIRLLAAFGPATPMYSSPYEAYRQAYRLLMAKDPATATETFIETYGAEFIPLTISVRKNLDGVPPTIEGYKASKKWGPLLEKYPELGGLIIGSDGAGVFNKHVYAYQSRQGGRVVRTPLEMEMEPERREGWHYFSMLMDAIDAVRIDRGLASLKVKGARDLVAKKKILVQQLAASFPAWYEDYQTTDRGARTSKLAGLIAIAAEHPKADSRPDLTGLRDYLTLRHAVTATLATRKSKSLDAKGNMALRSSFDAAIGSLMESNLAFSSLYNRYLDNMDLVDVDAELPLYEKVE